MDKVPNDVSSEIRDSVNVNISEKNKELELKGKAQLERLLRQYDLTKYLFTRNIMIESRVIPHSHPVLTLNTIDLENNDLALSTFIHEEFHWYVDSKGKDTDEAIDELEELYPEVPAGFPEGADDEYSTHSHLLVNFLEFEELKKLIGTERAIKAMEDKSYYKWIYKMVLEDNDRIRQVVEKHNLLMEE